MSFDRVSSVLEINNLFSDDLCRKKHALLTNYNKYLQSAISFCKLQSVNEMRKSLQWIKYEVNMYINIAISYI